MKYRHHSYVTSLTKLSDCCSTVDAIECKSQKSVNQLRKQTVVVTSIFWQRDFSLLTAAGSLLQSQCK